MVAIHGLLTFAAARLVRLDVETTAVASQAAVGGLLGYALGNYLGLAIAYLVRSL